MQSNSKLSAIQKSDLKEMREAMPEVNFEIMGKTIIAFHPVGDTVEFATAICADNEKKNRPKVGKYWAIKRFENGQTVKLPNYQFYDMVYANT